MTTTGTTHGRRRGWGRGRIAIGLLLAASLVPAAYLLAQQWREDAAVRQYLQANDFVGRPLTKATAIAVSQAVRRDFVVDKGRWTRYRLKGRPLLRHDTLWLLEAREGLCGEGARVLVNLLNGLGFDATRLTLYDRYLRPSHTLASVVIDGRETFVDSINTSAEFNAFLNERDLSVADFSLLHYREDLEERMDLGRALQSRPAGDGDELKQRFFERFRLYSYEAVPGSKLLALVGMDFRVFNLTRPPAWTSRLAEKPYAIKALAALAGGLVFDALLLAGVARARRRRGAPLS